MELVPAEQRAELALLGEIREDASTWPEVVQKRLRKGRISVDEFADFLQQWTSVMCRQLPWYHRARVTGWRAITWRSRKKEMKAMLKEKREACMAWVDQHYPEFYAAASQYAQSL